MSSTQQLVNGVRASISCSCGGATCGEPSVDSCKHLLHAAAMETGGKTTVDGAWARGGVERMFFEAEDRRVLGTVEIDTSAERVESVRMELMIPPELAAHLIRLVTGNITGLLAPEPVAIQEMPEPRTVVPFAPATKDPTPEDLLEEPDGLPSEVLGEGVGDSLTLQA